MDHHLLNKFAKGNCTAQEKMAVEEWLKEDSPLPSVSTDSLDQRIQSLAADRIQKKIHARRLSDGHLYKYLSAAAVLILISSIAVLKYPLWHPQEKMTSWKTMEVPDGQKASIKLPDGSTIELNGGSSLTYPDQFIKERVVKLVKGDAFFMIAKDPNHPFIVHTDASSRIKVLGTRFNVKRNTGSSNLEITLNSGKISFERKGCKAQLLRPGQQIQYSLNTHAITPPLPVDTLAAIAWRKNTLLFRDTPLKQVFREIEQAYGVRILANTTIKEQFINAEFSAEPLQRVLSLVCKTSKLNFKQTGNQVYITQSY